MTFDLEKARAMICHYRIENPGDADTDCGLEDLIRQANLAEEALDEIERLNAHINSACIESLRIAEEQAAEIERLREALDKSEQILAHKTKTSTHWYEEGLQTRADLVQCKRVIDQQAAKIRELEDAHKRSGTKYAKIINELRSSVYANIPGLKKQWDEILNIPANGKIGPDADAKSRVWKITKDRVDALKGEINGYDIYDNDIETHSLKMRRKNVLKTMLKEATD